jgi:hypothetical protein
VVATIHRFVLSALLVGLAVLAACAPEPWFPTLDIEIVRQMTPGNTRQLSFEETRSRVLVTVVDRYGDSHTHELVHPALSRPQAVALLTRKQAELALGK